MSEISRRLFLQASVAASGLAGAVRTDTSRKDLHLSQLFLDDTWIEETYRLERTWESADIYPEPVLKPETAWEGHQLTMLRVGVPARDRVAHVLRELQSAGAIAMLPGLQPRRCPLGETQPWAV